MSNTPVPDEEEDAVIEQRMTTMHSYQSLSSGPENFNRYIETYDGQRFVREGSQSMGMTVLEWLQNLVTIDRKEEHDDRIMAVRYTWIAMVQPKKEKE